MGNHREKMANGLIYRRVVVKAGTNVLTGGTNQLNQEIMSRLVDQVARLHILGVEVILVSSGAIAAGRQVLASDQERRDVPYRQVLAAVGQSRLMHTYEHLFGLQGVKVAQALVTRHDLTDRLGYLNVRNTLLALLDNAVLPVVNENDVVAVEEIGEDVFGDNDTLSALVANLVDADLLALLTDTDGLFTADPHRDPDAELIQRVERIDQSVEALAERYRGDVSRGGMPAKLAAAKLATASGVAVAISNGYESDVVVRLVRGEERGTFFPPTATKMESRRRWLLSGLSPSGGEILVDDGAVTALTKQNRSLLPAGVNEVRGNFGRGDVVYVVSGQDQRIACGIANYSAIDMRAIKGVGSGCIQAVLGHHFGSEVVHRNNMVIL